MTISLTKADVSDEDLLAVGTALKRREFASGSHARQLEEKFTRYLQAQGALTTPSCTTALLLALRTLDLGAGDEVIIPSLTCLAILNAVYQSGATPVLVENHFEPATMNFNLDSEAVSRAIGDRTKAIVVPHMFGVPADIKALVALGLPVIEDITLSLGSRVEGKPVGSFTELAVCSFHESKMISAGEGGILVARERALFERAVKLNRWEDKQAEWRQSGVQEEYEPGFNFSLNDLSAALGVAQFARLDSFVQARQKLAARYTEALASIPGIVLPTDQTEANVFFRYLLHTEANTATCIGRFQEAGIEVGRGVFPPLHSLLKRPDDDFPNATRASSSLLSLPLYPALQDSEVDHILTVATRILGQT